MKYNILYLGLDPSRFTAVLGDVHHFPIISIRPRPLAEIEPVFRILSSFTHMIFTSQTAVSIFCSYALQMNQILPKIPCLVVGQVTAEACRKRDLNVTHIAKQEQAEGIISLLETIPRYQTHFFYPHSEQARSVILDFFRSNLINHTPLMLYHPEVTDKMPQFDIKDFDVIVFTSPSTVNAFKNLFGTFPQESTYYAIGPITDAAIQRTFPNAAPAFKKRIVKFSNPNYDRL